MEFAPYQADPPERQRALSPSPARRPAPSSSSPPPRLPSSSTPSDPWGRAGAAEAQRLTTDGAHPHPSDLDAFETGLGLRLDVEAALAYVALPPAGGVALLLLETRSDYVRFHAWQSALLFAALFIVHILLSWSTVLSWMLFVGDMALIGFLAWKAYTDAPTLDRFEVPWFGPLASRILDDE